MPTTTELLVRKITASETINLRHRCLRAGLPVQTAHFEGDNLPTTAHFGAVVEGKVVGVVSLFETGMPERPGIPSLQLRGMAVDETLRKKGIGRALTEACKRYCLEKAITILWCNARKTAVSFYSRMGFGVLGDEFSLPGIGPHYRMLKIVKP